MERRSSHSTEEPSVMRLELQPSSCSKRSRKDAAGSPSLPFSLFPKLKKHKVPLPHASKIKLLTSIIVSVGKELTVITILSS